MDIKCTQYFDPHRIRIFSSSIKRFSRHSSSPFKTRFNIQDHLPGPRTYGINRTKIVVSGQTSTEPNDRYEDEHGHPHCGSKERSTLSLTSPTRSRGVSTTITEPTRASPESPPWEIRRDRGLGGSEDDPSSGFETIATRHETTLPSTLYPLPSTLYPLPTSPRSCHGANSRRRPIRLSKTVLEILERHAPHSSTPPYRWQTDRPTSKTFANPRPPDRDRWTMSHTPSKAPPHPTPPNSHCA